MSFINIVGIKTNLQTKIITKLKKATFVVTATVTLAAPILYVPTAFAISDTQAPIITSLNAPSPSTVDVTTDAALATDIVGTFSDDLSGVQSVAMTYTAPSGKTTSTQFTLRGGRKPGRRPNHIQTI